MAMPRWDALYWLSDERCRLDDVQFWLTTTDYHTPSTPEEFVFLKNRALLDSYRVLLDPLCPTRIVEVGIWHGAGLAFWDLLLRPEILLGIDLAPDAPMLRHYLTTHPASSVRPYFGVDQGDSVTVSQILQQEFPAQNIELLIDDASHMYAPARATFAAAFPFLRPGGLYVLEDWGWAHWPGVWQDTEAPLIAGPALSNLVFELVMLQASRSDLIAALHIDVYRVAVVRGTAPLPPIPLVLDDLLLTRGRTLGLL